MCSCENFSFLSAFFRPYFLLVLCLALYAGLCRKAPRLAATAGCFPHPDNFTDCGEKHDRGQMTPSDGAANKRRPGFSADALLIRLIARLVGEKKKRPGYPKALCLFTVKY